METKEMFAVIAVAVVLSIGVSLATVNLTGDATRGITGDAVTGKIVQSTGGLVQLQDDTAEGGQILLKSSTGGYNWYMDNNRGILRLVLMSSSWTGARVPFSISSVGNPSIKWNSVTVNAWNGCATPENHLVMTGCARSNGVQTVCLCKYDSDLSNDNITKIWYWAPIA